MKANRDSAGRPRREIFVFTAEEIKTACFIVIAFLLGVATKHYRQNHPVAPAKAAAVAPAHAGPQQAPKSRH